MQGSFHDGSQHSLTFVTEHHRQRHATDWHCNRLEVRLFGRKTRELAFLLDRISGMYDPDISGDAFVRQLAFTLRVALQAQLWTNFDMCEFDEGRSFSYRSPRNCCFNRVHSWQSALHDGTSLD